MNIALNRIHINRVLEKIQNGWLQRKKQKLLPAHTHTQRLAFIYSVLTHFQIIRMIVVSRERAASSGKT